MGIACTDGEDRFEATSLANGSILDDRAAASSRVRGRIMSNVVQCGSH
jgi:hypothetical protein